MAKLNLQTPTARKRLAPRGKPYKITLLPGVHLGYRAAQSGTGSWVVIAAKGDGSYWTDAFALADDQQDADGQKVLAYEQAANRCRALARGDANAAADRPATISDAIASYETDLTGRGRDAYNAPWVRGHLPPQLAAQPLALVTAKQLRDWRDGLLKARHDPGDAQPDAEGRESRVQPRRQARQAHRAPTRKRWKVGLEALPDTVTAREAVLTDAQVLAVVAAAYDEAPAFGLYVQMHAEVGARSSQLARLKVADLQPGRLMVPTLEKGPRPRKADRTPVRSRRTSQPSSRPPPLAAPPALRCCCATTASPGSPRSPTIGGRSSAPPAPPSCRTARRSTACGTPASRGRCCAACRSRWSPTGTTPARPDRGALRRAS